MSTTTNGYYDHETRPHHSHHSHHHTRSCSRESEMAFSLSVPRGCTLCLIKSTQSIQSCNILLKLNQVIQNPTHTNTPTKTRTKIRTNTRHTGTPSFSYTYKYTFQLTPQIRPQRTPTNTLTAELLRPCYHVTW